MFVEGFDAARTDQISARSLAEEQEEAGSADNTQFRLAGGYDGVTRYLWSTGVRRERA